MTELRNGIAWISGDAEVAHSAVDTEWRELRDGSSVLISALAAEDKASIAAWYAERFAELSPETMYARLCGLLESVSRFAEDLAGHRAVRAFAPDGVVVGIARCTRSDARADQGAHGKLSLAVARAWRDRGVASALVERLAQIVQAVGIEHLTASCPMTDPALVRVLSRLGPATVVPVGTHAVDIHVELE